MNDCRERLLLYVVTDRSWTSKQSLYQQVEETLAAGATLLQLREKSLEYKDFLKEAQEMKALADQYQVPLIINDNVQLAIEAGAAGVHVGQSDMEACDVRASIGPDMILGVTAKTVEQACRAQQQGADYLGVGAIFGSTTKKDAQSITIETLRNICEAVTIPVVAIGGITQDRISQLKGTKIAGAAVVSAVFASEDIKNATRELLKEIKTTID